ncbi:MAG: hypothetical protein HY319_26195 [Armatimonadetes bacterium]|nr:hypothetical protein [Armatimonadota bacterium]
MKVIPASIAAPALRGRSSGAAEQPPQNASEELSLEGLSTTDRFSVEINGQNVCTLTGDSPGALERFGIGAKQALNFATREVAGIASADPAFAFSQAARAVKPIVLQGIPDEFQGVTEQYFVPMLRAVQIGFNVKRFIDKWREGRDPERPRTLVNEVGTAFAGAHIVTDALGIVGAIGTTVPALSAVSGPFMAAAVAGDIAHFSFNMMEYVVQRGTAPPPAASKA